MKKLLVFLLLFTGARLSAQVPAYDQALALSERQQFDSVRLICNKELRLIPETDSTYKKLISLRIYSYLHQGLYTNAIPDYKWIIRNSPKEGENYIGISFVYGELRNYDSCFWYLKEALKLNTEDAVAYNNLCYYSTQAGQFRQAISYADKGLKMKPDSTWKGALLNNRGHAYYNLKKYKKALKDIEEGMIFFRDNSFAYYYRALANNGLKRYSLICDDLRKAEELGGVYLVKEMKKEMCR